VWASISDTQWVELALGGVARAVGFAALAPLLGLCQGGVRRRSLLAVVLALVIIPSLCDRAAARPVRLEPGPWLLTTAAGELGAGLVLGFALRALASGVAQAAQLLQLQMGFATSSASDEDEPEPLVRLHQITAVAMFFSWGGHRAAVAALLDLPALRCVSDDAGTMPVAALVDTLSRACWLGVSVAAPAIAALLTTRIVLELAARVMPQFGGDAVAAPIQVAIGMALLALSLSALRTAGDNDWSRFAELLSGLP
jgi:flagellar biosynthetic protein FliR